MFHLSTQGNTKILEQLKSEFKRTINWIKYQIKVSTQTQIQYLSYLIDPRFLVFLIIEEVKETILDFSQEIVKVL